MRRPVSDVQARVPDCAAVSLHRKPSLLMLQEDDFSAMYAAGEESGSRVLRRSADLAGMQDDHLGLYLPTTWCRVPSEQVDSCNVEGKC